MMDIHVEGDEFAEDHVQKIKEKATRRRGRGFNQVNENQETIEDRTAEYEAVEEDNDEAGPKRSIEGWILFVTGIQEESTEDDIATPFGDFGMIKNIHLNIDRRTGYLKGYALIEYESFNESKNALNAMNGKEINGQQIAVSWAFVKGPLKERKSSHKNNHH
ncbi:RNA-binding 8A [Brachionus plicatilis]|uniref:RNA-binding protein 8A n=1 Tax=Brachionus plicatilis TaxID=10195 RepID=A0A3M7QKK1_BRAPC|nr:RNA-binding 8A [Brachionus plicatilis]